eukprot:763740-Hanusia_phi.AAC.1
MVFNIPAELQDLPNPLTLRAVGKIFQRRWAVPVAVLAVCLFAHVSGVFTDDAGGGVNSPAWSFAEKLSKPLHYARYGVAGGAIFGSLMWVLVVSLSDKAEGKPTGPSEHWAQNDAMLLAVLLGLGMSTGAVCAFAGYAMWDILSLNLMKPPIGG